MTQTADFDVFCPGVLDVLSIGRGDLRLTLDVDKPEDVEQARSLIEEMLRKGYSIYVDTGEGDPVRVKSFDPKAMAYVIVEPPPKAGAGKRPAKKGTRRVPVAGSRATAVGRTAGG